MQLLTHVLALWSVIATIAYCQGGLPTINTPLSCRAPLPIEWFINNTQTASALSLWASSSLATASKNLSSYIQSQLMAGDTASVIIGTPWGPISEMNFGKLRSNTTGDNQTVNSQSLYRVASTTKVPLSHSLNSYCRSSLFWNYSFYSRRGNCLYSILLESISQNSTYRPT